MPNWVYNTLRVKGTKKRLTQFAWAIGSPSAAIDWTKLATVVPMTWDARDERRTGELEVDGHDMAQLCDALDTAENTKGKPTVLIADTVKGKGVSFIEGEQVALTRGLKSGERVVTEGALYLQDGERIRIVTER